MEKNVCTFIIIISNIKSIISRSTGRTLLCVEKETYSKKTDEDRENIPTVDEHMTRIEEAYPEEIHDLTVYMPVWSHGFNSGALAISRLISAYIEELDQELDSDGSDNSSDQEEANEDSDEKFRKYFFLRKGQIEMAEEEFPMLDT